MVYTDSAEAGGPGAVSVDPTARGLGDGPRRRQGPPRILQPGYAAAMITDLRLERWRGMKKANVAGLTGITILAGPNSCGKSSILEGLVIAAGSSPGDAVGRVVKRRYESWSGARWLFTGGAEEGATATATATASGSEGESAATLTWHDGQPPYDGLTPQGGAPFSWIETVLAVGTARRNAVTAFAGGDAYRFTQSGSAPASARARLVDGLGRTREPLHRVVSRAIETDRITDVDRIVHRLSGGLLSDVRIATEEPEKPVVYVRRNGGAVPISVAGDGIISLVRLACELSAPTGSVVLLEEPECSLHARAIWELTEVIAAAHASGVQVVLTTHSETLIDFLILHDELRDVLSLHACALSHQELTIRRAEGAEVRHLAVEVMRRLLSE